MGNVLTCFVKRMKSGESTRTFGRTRGMCNKLLYLVGDLMSVIEFQVSKTCFSQALVLQFNFLTGLRGSQVRRPWAELK